MTAAVPAITRTATPWFKAVAVIGGLSYLLLGFGLLSWVGFIVGRDEGIHRVHDLAGALVFGLLGPAAFFAQLREEWRTVGMTMLATAVAIAAVGLFTIALMAADQIAIVPILVILSIPTILLYFLHPERDTLLRSMWWPLPRAAGIFKISWPLVGTSLLAAFVGGSYIFDQVQEQLVAPAGDAHGREFHYVGMSVLAFTLVLGGMVAAARPQGWVAVGRLVAISAALFGFACIALPDLVSSLGVTGGAITLAFAAFFWSLVEREGRRP